MSKEEFEQEFEEGHLWEFPAPPYGDLLDIGETIFIYESGMKIGLGHVVSQNDDKMLVRIEFTTEPRLNILYYGTLREAAGLEDPS